MKVIALLGSQRRNGNTARAVSLVFDELARLAGAEGQTLTTESVHLADLHLADCLGCRICFSRGEEHCPHHADLHLLLEKIAAGSGLIAATPVYMDDVSGIMKTWMDRMAFTSHRPSLAGVCLMNLATTGSTSPAHTLRTLAGLSSWGLYLAASVGLVMGARMPANELQRVQKPLQKATRRFYLAMRDRSFESPGILPLATFRAQQLAWEKSPAESHDYHFWLDQGWLVRDRTYYLPHHAPAPRVWLARRLGELYYSLFIRPTLSF